MSRTSDAMRREWIKMDEERDASLEIPEDVTCYYGLRYGTTPGLNLLDVYEPAEKKGEKLPVIVVVHGGGWVYGDKERYRYYAADLAKRGFRVVCYSYRLAPEYKFPASFEDTNRVIEWMYDNAEKYAFDMANVFFAGDSAGGHMAGLYANICTNPDYAKNFDFRVPNGFVPRAMAMNCGVYQIFSGESNVGQAVLSPHADSDLMGDLLPEKGCAKERSILNVTDHVTPAFPPCFVMTAKGDHQLQQAPLLVDALEKNGVPYEYKIYGTDENPLYHVFHVNVREPAGQICNDEECEYFRRMMQ